MNNITPLHNRDLGRRRPDILETALAGMALAFSAWLAIAVCWAFATLIIRFGLATESLWISIVAGALVGIWAQTVGRR